MSTAGTSATETANTGEAPLGESRSQHRWEEMLGSLAELLPAPSTDVFVDGPAEQAKLFAARLAGELGTRRRPVQVTLDANRPRDVSIFLRTAPGGRHFPVYRKDSGDGAGRDARDRREREERADIVIDLHDVGWPVIRRVAAPLAARGSWYLPEGRAFFPWRAAASAPHIGAPQ